MIHLSHSVTGGRLGSELADDDEELAYALVALAEAGVDDEAVAEYLHGQNRDAVRDMCNALAMTLGED